jgi:hypothetical protein
MTLSFLYNPAVFISSISCRRRATRFSFIATICGEDKEREKRR